jgi:hypothetical protein
VREVNKILDGKDSGTGVCSAEWQPTRERLLTQAGVVEALRFCKEALGEFATDQCPEGWRAIEAYQKAERALAALKGVKPRSH